MNDIIEQFVQNIGARQRPEHTAYALMNTGLEENDPGSLCLLLPKECRPDQSDPAAGITVDFDGACASWTGSQGRPVRIGSKDAPLQPEIVIALTQPSGILTLFLDIENALPDEWSVLTAHSVH